MMRRLILPRVIKAITMSKVPSLKNVLVKMGYNQTDAENIQKLSKKGNFEMKNGKIKITIQ
jgi:hypothetical protein